METFFFWIIVQKDLKVPGWMMLVFAGSLNLASSMHEIKTNATWIVGDRLSFYPVWVLVPGEWRRTNPRDAPSLMLAAGGMGSMQSQPPGASGSSGEEIASSVDHMPWWWRVFSWLLILFSDVYFSCRKYMSGQSLWVSYHLTLFS